MTYSDPLVQLNILPNGDWELWLSGVKYLLQWFGAVLKVSGGGICYLLKEVGDQLLQRNCDLQSWSILIS